MAQVGARNIARAFPVSEIKNPNGRTIRFDVCGIPAHWEVARVQLPVQARVGGPAGVHVVDHEHRTCAKPVLCLVIFQHRLGNRSRLCAQDHGVVIRGPQHL